MENPIHSFREMNFMFQHNKNHKLKIKLWPVGACKRKKSDFCPNKIFVAFEFYLNV